MRENQFVGASLWLLLLGTPLFWLLAKLFLSSESVLVTECKLNTVHIRTSFYETILNSDFKS